MEQFEAQEIGRRIARARNERGMTQEELAEIAPFSKRSLQDYEAGSTIPYKHLRDLTRLLRKPEEWFLYGDETASREESDEDVGEVLAEVRAVRGEVAELRAAVRRLEAKRSPAEPAEASDGPG